MMANPTHIEKLRQVEAVFFRNRQDFGQWLVDRMGLSIERATEMATGETGDLAIGRWAVLSPGTGWRLVKNEEFLARYEAI